MIFESENLMQNQQNLKIQLREIIENYRDQFLNLREKENPYEIYNRIQNTLRYVYRISISGIIIFQTRKHHFPVDGPFFL